MVAHDHEGMESPAKADTCFSDRALERLRGADGREQIAAVLTAVDDVVDRIWVLQP
jgi:hypothetical protein